MIQNHLNHLCSMPGAHTTVNRAELRELLTTTGGQVLARGKLHDIKSRHLGAGIYQVRLKLDEPVARPKKHSRFHNGFQIRFDGPPGPESGRFVEVETLDGKGFKLGEWVQDGDDWLLRVEAEK